MVAPSGEQYEITGGGYRAVVTECGASLRLLEHDGQPLVAGFPEGEKSSGGAGQLLAPWPNRIADGRYTFEGVEQQLPLSEPARHNASHGLVRWAAWSVEELTAHSVSLVYRLMAQPGYGWTLDLHALFDLSADGLTVTVTATNLADAQAPYALGAHPYLTVGEGPVDGWELTLPASSRLTVDDRMIPTGREGVEDTEHDFRVARPIRGTVFDTAFGDLEKDRRGHTEVRLHDPASGRGAVLWLDAAHRWLQVYSAEAAATPRHALAVEPMTAPPDAFNSGEDLVVLAPAGSDGDEHSASWGIRAL